MIRIRRRRTLVKLISLTSGLFAVAVGFAITGFWMSYGLKMHLEYTYQRSLSDLSDHLNNLSVDLLKAQYAGTMTQLVGLSGQIRSEATAAATDLSQISTSDINFENTGKFLAQTGDYANSLSRSLTENRKLNENDRKSIESLYSNAQKLSQQVGDIVSDVQAGRLTLFKTENALERSQKSKEKAKPVSSVDSGFQNIEDNLSGIPALIYDGPYSDNMLKKNPELTKGRKLVTREVAKAAASKFFGIPASKITDDGETAGNLPTYNFKSGTKSIFVAKNGGIVVRMLDSRNAAKGKLNEQNAVQKTDQFLKGRQIANMKETYTLTGSNVCVVNCAYELGNVTCYTDLIKVGIALDNGEIASYDATGYIMNHKSRTLPAITVSQKAAMSLLSPALTEKGVSLALIPKEGTGEVLCYEFKCTGNKGAQDVLVYFNVKSAIEEQILILSKTPGGTLAI